MSNISPILVPSGLVRRLVVVVVGVLLMAACAPTPPPLGGSPFAQFDAERTALVNGHPVCTAHLKVEVSLDNDQAMFVVSLVYVRGPGWAGLPCTYPTWVFTSYLSCDDLSGAGGCGQWPVPTPDGDHGEYQITRAFRHRPDHATLFLSFTGNWLATGAATATKRSSVILCDSPTLGHRCRFQPLS